MRFTCEKSMLSMGLGIAGRTVAQKSSLSVIEGILCRAGHGVSLTGYNMETAITYRVDADVTEPGECILPDVNTGKSIRIPQSAMKELISGTIFAVSENQGRPIHTGVKFEVEDTAVSAIAVDGFRLARRTFHPAEPLGRTISFVVPAAGLKEVEKLLTDMEGDVAFTPGNKHILFRMGPTTLVCRLLDGDFLDWRKVVPTNCPIKLAAHVSDLASSIERVGLIVSEKYKSPVRCLFGNNELQMRTSNTIGAAEDRCAIAGNGNDLEIGFNVRYLADALKVIPSEEVILELTNGLSPIVLTPAEEKHDFAYMVLPVRIKSN